MAAARDTRSTKTERDIAAKKQKFLQHFEGLGTVNAAATAAGVSRATVYRWRKEDAEFAEAWDDAEELCTQRLEREAYRRAFEGVEKPIFQRGEQVGVETKFSDTLTIFLLKARRPDTYRERLSIEDDRRSREREEMAKESDEELDRRLTGVADNVTAIEDAPSKNGRKAA